MRPATTRRSATRNQITDRCDTVIAVPVRFCRISSGAIADARGYRTMTLTTPTEGRTAVPPLTYTRSNFSGEPPRTHFVLVHHVSVGGDPPIRVHPMTTTSPL